MRNTILTILLITIPAIATAQKHKQYIRQGNKEYSRNNYEQSEIEYRRALDENPGSGKAIFNLGDALYRKGKFEEAGVEFDKYSAVNQEKLSQAAAHFNRGNSFLQAGELEKSIDAYKSSLMADPSNHQAKYNLAYAQDLLNQQNQQEKNQDPENNENQDQEDKEQKQDNKGDDNENQNKGDQEEEKDDNQDQNQEDKPEENQSQNPGENKMTREDAERLLQALANNEQEVQEKVKKEKAAAARVKTLKNW